MTDRHVKFDASSRSLYFEDLNDGLVLTSAARTITETDLVTFAMFSGDWNPIHVDQSGGSSAAFSKPVVHGVAAFAITGGLIYAAGWFAATTVAALGYDSLKFLAPIFVGDTVHVRLTVLSHRLTSKGQGLLERRLDLIKQDGGIVQTSRSHLLLATKGTCHV